MTCTLPTYISSKVAIDDGQVELWVGNTAKEKGCLAVATPHHLKLSCCVVNFLEATVALHHTVAVYHQTLERHPGDDLYHVATLDVVLEGGTWKM